ncbi:hypothetical protein Snoj_57850 [Streptomyces nojiriensis]|uniref:Uncharacterized protein n=1 Tax=Streptomyces nojiriensis TaxID=66374 RepID=A0ABQ3SVC3_9ACTN|nr:hypothetical protein GCM10010205_25380 [Streptomyces nojiriensis]GHI71867.1 hypothetical protein Snoj_57850 [Streptomyces nojiriensis]
MGACTIGYGERPFGAEDMDCIVPRPAHGAESRHSPGIVRFPAVLRPSPGPCDEPGRGIPRPGS